MPFSAPPHHRELPAVFRQPDRSPLPGLCRRSAGPTSPLRASRDRGALTDVAVSGDWPDDALTALAPDSRTAIVTLTHDPKLDDPALAVALKSPAFYIASLGSKRTHARRCERLREAGFGDEEIARIHGPAGHPIGASSPAEIAISIMAELTQVRRRGKA